METAEETEAKAIARLRKASLAEVVARENVRKARRRGRNPKKEEAVLAAAVAETKAAAAAAVAATKAVVDAQWAEMYPSLKK
jgi:hypothetical protein